MKIKFSQKILNAGGEIVKNLSVETRRQSQTEYAIGAESALIFDRGNARVFAAFEIERAHASEADAAAFAATHAHELSLMSPATLAFDAESPRKTIEFEDAALAKLRVDADAASTNARYEFAARYPKDAQ